MYLMLWAEAGTSAFSVVLKLGFSIVDSRRRGSFVASAEQGSGE